MAPKKIVSPENPRYPGTILSSLDSQVTWEIIANFELLGQLQGFATKPKELGRMLQCSFSEVLLIDVQCSSTCYSSMTLPTSVADLTNFIVNI